MVYAATKRLQELGIRPIPVYHGDASITWLHKYIDAGHKLIGLSKRYFIGNRNGLRRYYDQVFNITEKYGVSCHGFACTGSEMWTYPWYSVDSTMIPKVSMGNLLYPTGNTLAKVFISERATTHQVDAALLEQIKKHGFSLKELSTNRTRRVSFNSIMLHEFTEKRKSNPWNRKTLF